MASHNLIWEAKLKDCLIGQPLRLSSFRSLVEDSGLVYVSSFSPPSLTALERETGAIVWHTMLNGFAGAMQFVGRNVLIRTSAGLYAVDKGNGRICWTYMSDNQDLELFYADPLIVNNTAFLPDRRCRVHAVDVVSGSFKWIRNLESEGLTVPCQFGNNIGIFTRDCSLILLNSQTGVETGREYSKQAFFSQPLRAGKKTLYVGQNFASFDAQGKLINDFQLPLAIGLQQPLLIGDKVFCLTSPENADSNLRYLTEFSLDGAVQNMLELNLPNAQLFADRKANLLVVQCNWGAEIFNPKTLHLETELRFDDLFPIVDSLIYDGRAYFVGSAGRVVHVRL